MNIVPNSFHIISLGCAKNLVDSSGIIRYLDLNGYAQSDEFRSANFIVVNTCGFVEDARKESIETLAKLSHKKAKGQYLIAAGCLSQRYQQELQKKVPGIDGIMGTRNLADILTVVRNLSDHAVGQKDQAFLNYPKLVNQPGISATAIQGGSSYLKISDGCRRGCAFCAIPLIKGPLVSRPQPEIITDAINLQSEGVKEINLIAQDVTDYAADIGETNGLSELLSNLLPQIPLVPWVRLLYTYPGNVSDRLIDLMAGENQLLPYLDMPLQHADPEVLRSMQRPSDMDGVKKSLEDMRRRIPDLVTRTTMIVGFPTETEASFTKLKDFVREFEFDHLGVFTYSMEKGTPAEKLGDPISAKIKHERMDELMRLQAEISLKKNQSLKGQQLQMLVEGVDPKQNVLIGRTFRDAPEIDGLVIATGNATQGDLITVRVTGVFPYDLYAEQVS